MPGDAIARVCGRFPLASHGFKTRRGVNAESALWAPRPVISPSARYLARRAAHAPPSAGSRSYMITWVLNAGEAAARRRAGPGSGRCWPAVAPSSTRDGAVQAHLASFGLHTPVLHWAFACPAVASQCRTTISTAFRWVSRRQRTDCSTEPIRAARRARMSNRSGSGIGLGGTLSASESSRYVMSQSPSTPDADATAESAPAAVNRVLRPYRGACPVTQQI